MSRPSAEEKSWDAADKTLSQAMNLADAYSELTNQQRVIFKFVIRDRILLERRRQRKNRNSRLG